ncbi:MAG: DUF6338 family protein [Nocardioidaceae bacterium]
MIPNTIAAFYAFLGLVAPGLVFQLLREQRRPALEETAFREASHIALTSLVFTTVAAMLLAVASRFVQSMPDISAWITRGNSYLEQHFWSVVITLLSEVVLACLIAWGVSTWLGRGQGTGAKTITKTSIWYQLFKESLPSDKVAWVQAELTDGSRVFGFVDFYTVGQKLAEREISLKGPDLAIQEKGGQVQKQVNFKYVTFKASEVLRMRVEHKPRIDT